MRSSRFVGLVVILACAGGCMLVTGVDFDAAHDRPPPSFDEAGVEIPPPSEPGQACGGDRFTCNGACVAKTDVNYGCGSAACAPCSVPFAKGVKCAGAACVPDGCVAGRDDCDKDPANGCEASLASPLTCGACGTKCPDAARLCSGGTCVASCPSGLTECSGSCVDTRTSIESCGLCDRKCNAPANGDPVCLNGSCSFTCRSGFGDCTNNPAKACDPLPKFYKDEDGDKVGGATSVFACAAPAGYVTTGGDCLDTNSNVYPGQAGFFGAPFTNALGAQSFDYDCSGTETESPSAPPHWFGCGGTCNATGFTPGASRPGAGVDIWCGSTSFHVCFMTSSCQMQMPMAGPLVCH